MIIDTHAHVTGPAEIHRYVRELAASLGPVRPQRPSLSDEMVEESLKEHLAEVGAVGTDLQLVSPRPWAIPTGERREAVVQAATRAANDMVAHCVKLHPESFRGIAGLPQVTGLSPRNCVEELERSVKDLGFVGCKINPDPGEGGTQTPHMGDEFWYPLYEKMVQLDVPGLVHGGPYRFSREPELGYFITEETVAAYGIVRSKLFRDFPALKIIIGHGGGYLPYQVGRGKAFRTADQARDPDLDSFGSAMKRLWYDTVLYNVESVDLLLKVAGVDRCLFGSDKPANGSVIDPDTGRALNDIKPMIDSIPWLSEADRLAVYEGNARQIYPALSN